MAVDNSGRLGTAQEITVAGTSAAVANAFGSGVRMVRLCSTTACRIAFGAAPTAVATGAYLPANAPENFVVNPGEKVAAIQESAGGKLSVVEIE
jgi:hypothetical protein